MRFQASRPGWRAGLGLAGAAVCLLAACSGVTAAPPAPQAATSPDTSDAWTALSQNTRLAQLTTAEPDIPAGPKLMSPAEARSAAPFAFGVPAWAPPGFQMQLQAEVIAPASKDGFASVSLNWENAQGAAIELSVSQGDSGSTLAGAGSDSETLQIGGQPASLRRQTGFGADRLTLSWTRAGLTYRLAAETGAATRDDLVRMAESVH